MQYSFFFLIIIIGLLISDPSFWVVLGISIVLLVVVVIACIVDLFRSISKPSRQSSSHKTSNQSVKNTGKISSFKDWSQSVDKNEPNKKSDNSRNQTNQVYDDYDDCEEYEEYDDDDYEQSNWNENRNSAKQKRIKNLRKDVNRLNREYRFESGFDPDWDEDDRLSEKYRHDEEKYLRARKLELEERNRSYDNYLAPDERDRFKDETDEEW